MILKYRKRHLMAWILIAIVIITLSIIAYINIPHLPQ
jgi:hypothetical protein